jgi:hypothetical protein
LTGGEAAEGSKDRHSRKRGKKRKINDERIEKNDEKKHKCYGDGEMQQL